MASVFINSLTYTVPIEQVDALLEDHLSWMKANHEAGHFLAWGPCEPRVRGLIFMRAKDAGEAKALAASDPFLIGNVANSEIIEWTPRFLGPGLEAFGE